METSTGAQVAESLRKVAGSLSSLLSEVDQTLVSMDFSSIVWLSPSGDRFFSYSPRTDWPTGWPTWLPSVIDGRSLSDDIDQARYVADEDADETGRSYEPCKLPVEEILRAAIQGDAPDWMDCGVITLEPSTASYRLSIDQLIDDIQRCENLLAAVSPDWLARVDTVAGQLWREMLLRDVLDPLKFWPGSEEGRYSSSALEYPRTYRNYIELLQRYDPRARWYQLSEALNRYVADAEACRYFAAATAKYHSTEPSLNDVEELRKKIRHSIETMGSGLRTSAPLTSRESVLASYVTIGRMG